MHLGQLATRLRRSGPLPVDNLVLYESVSSTNDVGRRIASVWPGDLVLPPTLLVALEQRAGRGRDGRPWVSPPGSGAYVTLVWPLEDRRVLARTPLAVAVGLCEALRSIGVRSCRVKWPNDLVVGERKLGGILIEVSGPATGPARAIIGCGINVAIERERLGSLAAASIESETGSAPALSEVVTGGVRAVCRELRDLEERTNLVGRYRDKIVHRPGDRLIWRQGREIIEGRYRAIDGNGCLELETESGLRVVNAGEIVVG